MNTKYVYPAIISEEEGCITVDFPDLSIHTFGEDLNDALVMASDALCLALYDMEEAGVTLPAPSNIKAVKCDENSFVTLIRCDTMEYRKYFNNKAVKKTLTIPAWLNTMAERDDLNFSAILQEALKKELKI